MSLPFEFTIRKRANTKRLSIKVEQGGAVVVSAPKLIPDFLVKKFLSKHSDWVTKQLEKQNKQPKFNTPEAISIFGKRYTKNFQFSLTDKIGVYIQGNTLRYNPATQPDLSSPELKKEWQTKFNTKIEAFLKNTATHYLIPRTHALAEKMGTRFNKITLKKQKTRWGSCSSKRNLNFNWQLVYFAPQIIDYVIIHELAHLTHMNHSRAFWALVAKYDPNYEQRVNWLKKNGLSVG